MYHTLVKLFFFLAVTTSAAPRPANNKRQATVFPDLSAYTYIYPTPGISWKYVFGAPGIPAECSLRQQAILIDAVQATEEFLAEASTAKDTDFAWQQFFLYVNPLQPIAGMHPAKPAIHIPTSEVRASSCLILQSLG